MRSKSHIIPATLVNNEKSFHEHLHFARGSSKSLHIDVIDGKFCPGQTLPVDAWPNIDLEYSEAHLMVEKPIDYLREIKQKGVTRAIIHVESEFDLGELTSLARDIDLLIGFAVNPETDLEKLRPYCSTSGYYQIMGVHPGRIGQVLLDTTPLAISYVRRTSPNHRLTITVDGGVNKNNIKELKVAGADFFISSAAIYEGEKTWQENYTDLMEALR